MAQMGAEARFDKEKCTVFKDGKNITIGYVLEGKLYRANTPDFAQLSTVSNLPSMKIWHETCLNSY